MDFLTGENQDKMDIWRKNFERWTIMNEFCVYIQLHDGIPFYVGMSCQPDLRPFNLGSAHNEEYNKFMEAHRSSDGITVRISKNKFTKQVAADFEMQTVRDLRLQGFKLFNIHPVESARKSSAAERKAAGARIRSYFTVSSDWSERGLMELGRNLRGMVYASLTRSGQRPARR